MMCNCVERALHTFFYKYGGFVAKHPLPFLLLPILIAGALGAGMMFLTSENDIEDLYAPENSPAFDARETIDNIYDIFGDNDSLPRQSTELGLFGQVIVEHKKNDNVLTVAALEDALRLHSVIMNISVQYSGDTFTFSDLCRMWNGQCDKVNILDLYSSEDVSIHNISYPLASNSDGKVFFVGSELGRVSFQDNTSYVDKAGFMQFAYYLRYDDTEEEAVGLLWENEFLRQVNAYTSDELTIYQRVSQSLEEELDVASKAVIPLFSITFTILINFSIWSSIMRDNVRSKPWLASLGVVSAALAVISSFGLMSYLGIPYINVVGSAPFLIMGIGVDDMFVMIAAWRKTNVHKSTKERMSESFADAAMSITITTVTDALAFGIGAITYFRSVRIFCMYTGVAVLFDYAYQITFFAAVMALTGYREEKNLHAMTCRKVLPKEKATSKAYLVCCAGGSAPLSPEEVSQTQASGDNYETAHVFMFFFKRYFGPFLTHTFTTIGIVILYFLYLGIAIWGVLTLEEGLKLRNLSTDGSYVGAYYDLESKHFRDYGPVVMIVVTERIDYSNLDIQNKLDRVLTELEDSDFFHGKKFTMSWLRQFNEYLNLRDSMSIAKGSENRSVDFSVDVLQSEFLKIADYRQFLPDIRFDDRNSSIVSSRFYVVSKNINSTNRERDMMLKAREIAKESFLPVIVYHPAFVFYDQYIEIRPNTIQNLGVALAAMFLVALVMIPHPLCSLLVVVSLVSIVVGVIGFMSHWNVALDSVSMINLILCIGFSVDFSAHITYGFITAPGDSSRKRVIHALYSLGMPITQGALSTILAVAILSSSNSYIFRTFFKTMFLVIGFGALHGLVFLPVFLMLLTPSRSNWMSKQRDSDPTSFDPDDRPHCRLQTNPLLEVKSADIYKRTGNVTEVDLA